MSRGILRIAELIWEILDQDINFAGTAYDGPAIVMARADMPEGPVPMPSDPTPNLMRYAVRVYYQRVREGEGTKPGNSTLIVAVKEKLSTNLELKAIIGSRVSEVDNINDPRLDGITTQKPWVAVTIGGWETEKRFGGIREEFVPIWIYVYQQRYAKDVQECLTKE